MSIILTSLFKFINNPEIKDNNYQISKTLLQNITHIQDMKVAQLSKMCYVSSSTFNRFIHQLGYSKYQLFKLHLHSQMGIRYSQMKERLNHKNETQVQLILKNILDEDNYQKVINKEVIHKISKDILKSNNIYLIGADEMEASMLRFQIDFCLMNKLMILKDTNIEDINVLKENDIVFLLSMTGRIINRNNELINKLKEKNINVYHFGYKHKDYENNLYIPRNVDEVIENMIFDYYLQSILYNYMREYFNKS